MLAPLLADTLCSLTLSSGSRHLSSVLCIYWQSFPESPGVLRAPGELDAFKLPGRVVGSPRLCEIWEQWP